jgi:arylsulfatase A-like enzyme
LLRALAILSILAEGSGLCAASARRPNIVLILADDLGRGHVGVYGQKQIHTPQIDRLAAEGIKFNNCYSGSNVCAPSRSTLMTGLDTGHTPVRNNGLNRYLYDTDVTLAEVLKRAGYATGGFGKWGLGEQTTQGFALRQGFDEWFGQYSQVHAHFHYPWFLFHNGERYPLPGNEGKQRGQYAHDEIHAQALAFIRRQAAEGQPFFCYLPYVLPHIELVVPEDSMAEYTGKFPKQPLPPHRPGYLSSDDAYTTYAGMVGRLDRSVGQVMALLKELKIDDNTLVLFTSDNGPQGGPWASVAVDFFHGAGPYRGSKGNFYEGGIRTPLLVRWPGKISPGSQTDRICAFWDFLPTLAEVAGAQPPPGIDGISFLPTLLGQPGQREHEFLYWEQPFPKGLTQAVRMGNWKAIRPQPGGPLALYDLANDIAEKYDVASSHPEVVRKIEAIMQREHTPERVYQPHAPEGVDDYVR